VLRGQRWAALLGGIAFALLVALTLGRAFTDTTPANLQTANSGGTNVNSLAALIFTKYLFAFELTSALLIVAAVGAMILAYIERDGPKPTQKATARERIRSGRPQPLPGPGVLSSSTAIGTPALLPDGSASAESVMSSTPGGRERPEQRSLPSSEGTE
jgi:NADH-quinone oxidoreductase subunit J